MTYEGTDWSFGRIAFETYNHSVSAGASRLRWEDLPDSTQEAWDLAALKVIQEYKGDEESDALDGWGL